jgi:hypothetical protein
MIPHLLVLLSLHCRRRLLHTHTTRYHFEHVCSNDVPLAYPFSASNASAKASRHPRFAPCRPKYASSPCKSQTRFSAPPSTHSPHFSFLPCSPIDVASFRLTRVLHARARKITRGNMGCSVQPLVSCDATDDSTCRMFQATE